MHPKQLEMIKKGDNVELGAELNSAMHGNALFITLFTSLTTASNTSPLKGLKTIACGTNEDSHKGNHLPTDHEINTTTARLHENILWEATMSEEECHVLGKRGNNNVIQPPSREHTGRHTLNTQTCWCDKYYSELIEFRWIENSLTVFQEEAHLVLDRVDNKSSSWLDEAITNTLNACDSNYKSTPDRQEYQNAKSGQSSQKKFTNEAAWSVSPY